jgi:hypothetical protein
MSSKERLVSAKELAKKSRVRFPNEGDETAAPAEHSSPRRSSFGAISSASPSSVARCRRAAG